MSNTCFISVSVGSCISLSGDTDSLKHTLLLMFLFPLPLLHFQFLLSPWSSELFFILDLSTCLGKNCFYTIPFCFDCHSLTSSQCAGPWISPNAKHQLSPLKLGWLNIPQGKDPSLKATSRYYTKEVWEKECRWLSTGCVWRHMHCLISSKTLNGCWTRTESIAPSFVPHLLARSWRGLDKGNQDRHQYRVATQEVWISGVYYLIETASYFDSL